MKPFLHRMIRLLPTLLLLLPFSVQANQQRDPALGPLLQKALRDGKCFEDKFDRAVWFAAMEPRLKRIVKDETERSLILEQVQCKAKRLQLPPRAGDGGDRRKAVSTAGQPPRPARSA
jgi:hypothetical protein